MNWEDERYVRLYTRDTITWKLIEWQGRCLLPLLLRKVDRAGCIELEGTREDGIAALVDIPIEVVKPGLAKMIERGVVELRGDILVFPKYVAAHEARQSDKLRAKESRARRRASAMDGETITNGDAIVTNRDETSHGVTPSHTASLSENVLRESENQRIAQRIREQDPSSSPKGDLPGDSTKLPRTPKSDGLKAIAIGLLAELSAARIRVDKACRPLEPVRGNLEQILGRLQDNPPCTADQLRHVIAVCEVRSKHDSKTREWFDAVSPFRARNIGRWLAMTVEQAAAPPTLFAPERNWPPGKPTTDRSSTGDGFLRLAHRREQEEMEAGDDPESEGT